MSGKTSKEEGSGALNHKIKQQFQRSSYDCGHTCLDMLGYDGHNMLKDREIASKDLRSLPGAKEVTIPVGQEETLDYKIPHIWLVLPKPGFAAKTSAHFVIRQDDTIYCPTVGAMDAHEYKNKYVAFVLQQFIIPFKG